MKTKLSVNINKVALLRNSRPGNNPDLYKYAEDCEMFGADGITVHPRPDERHIRYADVPILRTINKTELNIEGNPIDRFMKMIENVKPQQCTLVPDSPEALTSDTGWDTKQHKSFLKETCARLREQGIRSSLFLNPDMNMVDTLDEIKPDRIELYTGVFAKLHANNVDWKKELDKHSEVAKAVSILDIGVNAGHDLNLYNLSLYKSAVTKLLEVSIGHALTIDSIYYGLKNTIQMYQRKLVEL